MERILAKISVLEREVEFDTERWTTWNTYIHNHQINSDASQISGYELYVRNCKELARLRKELDIYKEEYNSSLCIIN